MTDDGRGIPRTKRIGEVKSIDDLREGERAVPESNQIYLLRDPGGRPIKGTDVDCIIKIDGKIYAHGQYFQPVQIFPRLRGGDARDLHARNRNWDRPKHKAIPKPRTI